MFTCDVLNLYYVKILMCSALYAASSAEKLALNISLIKRCRVTEYRSLRQLCTVSAAECSPKPLYEPVKMLFSLPLLVLLSISPMLLDIPDLYAAAGAPNSTLASS